MIEEHVRSSEGQDLPATAEPNESPHTAKSEHSADSPAETIEDLLEEVQPAATGAAIGAQEAPPSPFLSVHPDETRESSKSPSTEAVEAVKEDLIEAVRTSAKELGSRRTARVIAGQVAQAVKAKVTDTRSPGGDGSDGHKSAG
jgi:hypothetical protein